MSADDTGALPGLVAHEPPKVFKEFFSGSEFILRMSIEIAINLNGSVKQRARTVNRSYMAGVFDPCLSKQSIPIRKLVQDELATLPSVSVGTPDRAIHERAPLTFSPLDSIHFVASLMR